MVLAMRAVTQAAAISLASGRLARATVAAVLMTLALWGLDELGASLGVLVVAAAAIYLPLVVALRALDIAELRSLLRRA